MTDKPQNAENILRIDHSFNDNPLGLRDIDGIYEAIEEVAETHEDVIVESDGIVECYKVFWNEPTETVRIGSMPVCATYEVPQEYTE